MNRKIGLRIVSILVMLVMGLNGVLAVSADAADNKLTIQNAYVSLSVNKDNGRFTVRTVAGSMNREEDNDKPLLYEELVPDTSFTTFKIGSKEYIYGNSYQYMGLGDNFQAYPANSGMENGSVWKIDGVEITQKLTVVADETDRSAGNVKISYRVKNTTDKPVDIGSRVLLDTLVGNNDAAPVMLPGSSAYITKETTLEGSDIPLYWKAVDDVKVPKVVSYGLLGGWQNIMPDQITFAHWDNLSRTKWGYTPDTDFDFTSGSNSLEKADSAVALTWKQASLAAGEERVYETYYGIGDFSTEGSKANFTASSFGPEKLAVNAAGTGYRQEEFTVGMQIDNSFSQSVELKNVSAKLEYSYGLKLVSGESTEKAVGNIGVNEIKNIAFRMKALPHYKTGIPYYRITLTMDGLETPIVKTGVILVPSLTGEPPEISFTSFAPASLYKSDDKKNITILGKGFDLLNQDDSWKLTLINTESGLETEIPREYIAVGGDNMVVSIPNALTAVSKEGAYKLKVDYSYQGVKKSFGFAATLTMSSQEAYKVREYKVLQVLRKKVNDEYQYSINEYESEKNAPTGYQDAKIMLEIRGNVRKTGEVYTINDAKSTINSLITFEYNTADTLLSPKPLTIRKCAADLTHQKAYVCIYGSGRLNLGNFPFCLGGFAIELEDGVQYTTEPEEKDEEEAERISIVPTFLGLKIPNIEGLPITVKNATIGKNYVSFGGELDFGAFLNSMTGVAFPKDKKDKNDGKNNGNSENKDKVKNSEEEDDDDGEIELALRVDELRFGVSDSDPNVLTYQGIKAGGKLGVPKEIIGKLVPSLDIGGSIEVEYNTFENESMFVEASADIFIVQGDITIKMKKMTVGKAEFFIPDTIVMSGGSNEPGIPIIPPTPVAYLTKLGGGFENLYDTITGNFTMLPPLNLKAIAGFNLAKIFSADRVTLDVSLRGIKLTASDMKIVKVKILKEVSLGFTIQDTLLTERVKFDIKGTAKIDIYSIIVGDATLYFGVDSSKRGVLGPISLGGSVNGRIQVPPQIPFIGGMNLGGASAGISDENVYARVQILGIPVGIKYVWGSAMPILTQKSGYLLASNELILPQEEYLAYVIPESKEGEETGGIIFGDNIRQLNVSEHPRMRVFAAAEGFDYSRLELAGAVESYDYSFQVGDGQKYGLIQAAYDGDAPVLALKDSSGAVVQLVEGTNYKLQTIDKTVSQSGRTEQYAFITLTDPMPGTWTLSSDRQLDMKAMDVAPIPKLTGLSATVEDGKIKAEWNGTEMGNTALSFYLCNDETDAGIFVAGGIDNTQGQVVLDFPEKINSGEYYLRAQLEDSEKTYSSLYAGTKLTRIDPNQPDLPSDLQVEQAGDGLLKVSWTPSDDAEGYYLEVFDSSGKSQGIIEAEGGTTAEKIIGGTISNKTTDSEGNEIIQEGGIIPGNSYMVELVAYKAVNDILHMTPPVRSGTVSVNRPNPANLVLVPSLTDGTLKEVTDTDGSKYYLTNSESVGLTFRSDQQVSSILTLNDEDVLALDKDALTAEGASYTWSRECVLKEGENTIFAFGYNASGDSSKTGIRIVRDTKAPELKIDSPQPGELVSGAAIRVTGFAELGSTLTVNGNPVEKNADNTFETTVEAGQEISQDITVAARDEAGNETEYKTTVFLNNLKEIKRVFIRNEKSVMGINEEQKLSLWAEDDQGNEVKLGQNLVKWELLDGAGCSSLSEEGTLKALSEGSAVVRAAFAVSGEYEFEDATMVKIGEETAAEIGSFQVAPAGLSLKTGEEKQLNASLLYKDMTTSELDGEEVQWEMTSFSDGSASVSSKGIVKGIKKGSSVVKATYSKDGKTFEAFVTVSVTVSSDPDKDKGDTGSSSLPDDKVIKILDNIVTNEEANDKPNVYTLNLQARIDNSSGIAMAGISPEEASRLAEEAKKNEAAGKESLIEFKIQGAEGVKSVELQIPRAAFDKIADETKADLKIAAGIGSITFDTEAMDAISSGAEGDVKVNIAKADSSGLSAEDKMLVGDRPVFSFSVKAGEEEISDFTGGSATIAVPYTPGPGEDYDSIVVFYIDGSGKLKPVRGRYDEKTGTVGFVTGHLSRYAIGYRKVSFRDVAPGAWYAKAVGFIGARGITEGTGNGCFSPSASLTRADYLVMTMKAYGMEPITDSKDNFRDAGNKYYTGYLAAAKQLGISKGTGNNLYEPEKVIDREEMFTLLYNILKATGEVPGSINNGRLSSFADGDRVADWAEEPMTILIKAGIIDGSGGVLKPKAEANRAEMAQVLYKLLLKIK